VKIILPVFFVHTFSRF